MARQSINIGTTPGDGTGDKLHEGGDKVNDMTLEIYDGGDFRSGSFTLTPSDGDYTISQTNWFVQQGKLYFMFFDFEVTATNTAGTGSFTLTGVPGSAASNHSGGGLNFLSGLTKTGVDWVAPWISSSSMVLRGHSLGGGSGSTIQYSDFGSTFRFRGMAIFRVA